MANVVKINLGSLGSLGGEGNLRNVSLHDSTCQCEGCVEKRLADREFSIRTDKVFGAKDYGFNDGDEENLFNEAGEVIVLGDDESSSDDCSSSNDDDDDKGSVSDIFDIYDDPPNDDGYCDDGRDSEDAYSVCSPKPCTIDTNTQQNPELGTNGEDDIKEEDTPPLPTSDFEDTINLSSIEAAKKDGQSIKDCADAINNSPYPTIQMNDLHTFMDEQRYSAAKYWKGQVQNYKTKITKLFKTISSHEDVIKAAKRRMDYDEYEINRLRTLCMNKTAEVNKKDRQIYSMASDMGRQALRHNDINQHQQTTIADLNVDFLKKEENQPR